VEKPHGTRCIGQDRIFPTPFFLQRHLNLGAFAKKFRRSRDQANAWGLIQPQRANRNATSTRRQPQPYTTLRRKLMEEASGA
jgi:hypothetical protein